MTTFEVAIQSPDSKSVSLKLLIEADNWVDAWREGLEVMGDEAAPSDAVCVMEGSHVVHIQVPSSRRTFVVRQLDPGTTIEIPGPLPGPGQAVLITSLDGAQDGSNPARGIRVFTPRSGPAPPLSDRPPLKRNPLGNGDVSPAIPTTTGAGKRRSSTLPAHAVEEPRGIEKTLEGRGVPARRLLGELPLDVDPRARVLSPGDRERLSTEGEAPSDEDRDAANTGRRRRGRESTYVGRPAPTTGSKRRPEEPTSAFVPVPAGEPLPQQFKAIPGQPGERITPEAALSKAVDTAWQHVPCQIAQVLCFGDDEAMEVVAARGERERETLASRVAEREAFRNLTSGREARVKFSSDTVLLRYVMPDDSTMELPVRSALCVPIVVEGEQYGVIALLNSPRRTGFADGELRAVRYLARTLSATLTELAFLQ